MQLKAVEFTEKVYSGCGKVSKRTEILSEEEGGD